MSQVFISYKQEERDRIQPIADALRALKIDVWFDARLQPDRPFIEEIQELIKTCSAQLVCWSPLAAKSDWVLGEADKGRQRGVLIAVTIEPCDLPPPFNMHHAENLSGWRGNPRHSGWLKVIDAVGRKLDRPGLKELSVLGDGGNPELWRRWAGKYPNDPFADQAWANAEELEITAAKARTTRDRELAKRAAEQAAALKAAQAPSRAAPHVTPSPLPTAPERPRPGPLLVGSIIGALGLAAALGMFVVTRNGNDVAPPKDVKSNSPLEQTATNAPGKQPDGGTALVIPGSAPLVAPQPETQSLSTATRGGAADMTKADASRFQICSKVSGKKLEIAIAYQRPDQRWQSEGWHELRDGQCLSRETLSSDHGVYLYARAQGGNLQWYDDRQTDGRVFCYDETGPFAISDAETNCDSRKHKLIRFRRIMVPRYNLSE